ncbi:alanine racemase [Bacillus sp. FJAT-45350]|uniref:alanine racemase n=1 Tax=Bacillus sp. FJAT-45350 TaxID=2011014 RepID=UPI000BB91557|nr:alanine racemase [Bacillus sp. FJAT-45350]
MKIVEGYYRDTWVEVNLDYIEENIRSIKANFQRDIHVMAVVKADGYGHGATATANAAVKAGASYIGVALLDEALQLREDGVTVPILVLGRTRPKDIDLAIRNEITVTVFQKEWLIEANKESEEEKPLLVHVKFDTGMGRIGITTKEEGKDVIKCIKESSKFILEGVFTHFATADELDLSYFDKQYERFTDVLSWLNDWGASVRFIHCGNSATGLRFPDKAFNMFRLGISMYGLTPSIDIKAELPVHLKEAFSLRSKLVQVKQVPPGEGISYGKTYETKEWEWVGTIPIGYADGWYRYHSTSGGYVLIDGKKAPFIGRICMDQCMVKLPYQVEVGTTVTLIGADGGSMIGMDDVASRLRTINYEIPCMISYRVPRKYYQNGHEVSVRNRIY